MCILPQTVHACFHYVKSNSYELCQRSKNEEPCNSVRINGDNVSKRGICGYCQVKHDESLDRIIKWTREDITKAIDGENEKSFDLIGCMMKEAVNLWKIARFHPEWFIKCNFENNFAGLTQTFQKAIVARLVQGSLGEYNEPTHSTASGQTSNTVEYDTTQGWDKAKTCRLHDPNSYFSNDVAVWFLLEAEKLCFENPAVSDELSEPHPSSVGYAENFASSESQTVTVDLVMPSNEPMGATAKTRLGFLSCLR
ncbi:hypothetical protein B0O99DRAFT_698198 [Bisporella sp. PMI_857]|nr:hypothetical protein B0O99DRAFT_698198 [Bisporella sp. PMI_857]